MDLGLQDKPVLVLASSGGLGAAVAKAFAQEGARVALFARNAEALHQRADEIESETGHRPLVIVGDLTHPGDVEIAVEETVVAYGGLYALFNNTGGPPAGGFEDFDDAAWEGAFQLTLMGYVRAIRAALPHFRAGGGGRILNNSSASIKQAIDGLLLSNVFRSGLVGLGKSLAREFGKDQILVNTIGPGRIDTERVAQLDELWAGQKGIDYDAQRTDVEGSIPLGKYGEPEDFARTAVYLCSAANRYVSGQNILVDGAMVGAY